MEKVIIIGADIEIIELIENNEKYELAGIVDNRLKSQYYGYDIIGNDNHIIANNTKYNKHKIIITIDDVVSKQELYTLYKNNGFNFFSLISTKALVSGRSEIFEGVIIQSGVNIGPNTKLGKCTKINTFSNLMHDVEIGSFSTIAPGTTILGYCKIGNEVFIGGNVTVLPNIIIPDRCIIGAGSVVTKNLRSERTFVGNPARSINVK